MINTNLYKYQNNQIKPFSYSEQLVVKSGLNQKVGKIAIGILTAGLVVFSLKNRSFSLGGASLISLGVLIKASLIKEPLKPRIITSLKQFKSCDLSEVEEIVLRFTDLEKIPEGFNPPKLRLIDIMGAEIKELPSGFNPPNLKVLVLGSTKITSLPDDFNPPNLQKLDLSFNRIASLPSKFNPPKLRDLNLCYTKLASLPDEFNPPNLEEINLSRTHITHLPKEFNPPKLKELSLSYTRLMHLPEGFNPPKLRKLDMSSTPITHLPSEFNPPQLMKLFMTYTQLQSVPDRFNPPNLEEFFVAETQVTSLPENFNPPSLVSINLRYCQITSLPDGFNPPYLRVCNLNSVPITHLPSGFNPPFLDWIDLEGTDITTLPTGFNPPSLRDLYLDGCRELTSLPERILSFPRSCTVHLTLSIFPVTVQRRLQDYIGQEDYEGPQFEFGMGIDHSIEESANATIAMQKLLDSGSDTITCADNLVSDLLQDASHLPSTRNHIRTWLDRIFYSASAKAENKESFFKSIIENLKVVAQDSELRSFYQDLVGGTTGTCGDGITLSALQLANHVKAKTMNIAAPKAVHQFLVNTIYAMDVLHKIADNIIPTLPLTDPIEVYLGLPFKLKEEFSIGININEMLFYRCSGLTDTHLNQAKNNLREALDDKDKVLSFLIEQPKWIELLKHTFSNRYQDIEEKKFEDAEDLSKVNLSEANYKEALKELSCELIEEINL